MNETREKKRGWVKNVAIIFLSIMLVLTFFSNTFMNRSLAEVSTKYVISSEITTKVRGSGTVTANENYEVVLNQSRGVESVKVQVGDEVREGDVLFVLSTGDSNELKSAEEALRSANLAYQRALINATELDYAKEDRDIALAREELEVAQAELKAYGGDTMTLQQAKSKMDTAKAVMDSYQTEVTKYQTQLSGLNGYSSDTSSQYSAYQTAEQDLTDARRDFNSKLLTYGASYKSLLTRVVTDRMNAANTFGAQSDEVTALSDLYTELEYAKFTQVSADINAAQSSLNTYLNTAGDAAKKLNNEFANKWQGQLSVYMDAAVNGGYSGVGDQSIKADEVPKNADSADVVPQAESGTAAAGTETAGPETTAYKELTEASAALTNAQRQRDAAYSAYISAVGNDDSGEYNRVSRLLQKAQENLDSAAVTYENAKSIYDGLSAATETVNKKERALEDLLFALEEQKKADNKTVQLEALELQNLRYNVTDAQERVDELKAEATEPKVTAKVSGIIGAINITAGKTAEAGTTICTITVPDMGYGLSFSVTTDQAKKVRVGDEAAISNYYGSDIHATLAGIKTDPKDPQNSRVLNFDITGDVEAGTTLNLSVGQKSAQYDTVVPNSAIRSDSNGDFVLVVTSKSSPLGNRYIATRVDVEKLLSDDTNTAVSGDLNAYDYVITTSSKPINDGDMVRLAE